MCQKIALFNHKGRVGKTTTSFHLGWMLASKGHTVILVDADPQSNLTGLVLEYTGWQDLEQFYEQELARNLRAGLAPAFESRPELIRPVACVEVRGQPGLYLLPGHIRLSEYEVTLGLAQALSNSIHALRNIPGAIAYLLEQTAAKFQADYVIIDMNPSLSAINQNLVMISDFFLIPTYPDYFSAMAIESLATVLPKWHAWGSKASSLTMLREASYPFPQTTPQFLGTIIQNYRPRGGAPTRGFQAWIEKINTAVAEKLAPVLDENQMLLPRDAYQQHGMEPHYLLGTIPDFNSLITKSQEHHTPVFALSAEQLERTGVVLDNSQATQDMFKQIYSDIADKVVGLTHAHHTSHAIHASRN